MLLKRWKRLEVGLDTSVQAFKALSEHFIDKTRQWLEEDKDAQARRKVSPSAMDIYDTVQDKAPSCAMIQQELMVEENGDHSIRGQTSWISCGLKIQELQLVIKYQLRSHGSNMSVEDAQILDNKRARLQRLIDMFSHQSDTFLLNHELTEDITMASLGDYMEYDHADDLDDSGAPGHSSRTISKTCDNSGINAEDIPLFLPSSLGWDWCTHHGHKSLANKEAKLRFAQATDALHRIRLALGFKSAIFWTHVRHSQTQKTKSRAWSTIHSVDASVQEHACNYSMARDTYLRITDSSDAFEESNKPSMLPSLKLADLQVNTVVLGAAPTGQRNQQLSWIWSFGTSTRQDGAWIDDFNQVHWLRAKAQFERWKEEQYSIHNEAVWVPGYFHAQAELWKARMNLSVQECNLGHAAYASRQAHAWDELVISSTKTLSPITSSLLKHV
ncbi:hypothetical protein EI94DRAFT_1811566 [Lactarius quietus]|nr:hypothetical protein EI94DRAFT_1811566 [Lactarius quietus]